MAPSFYLYWRNKPTSTKQRSRTPIKANMSTIACMITYKITPLHEIDWEKVAFLDKERNYDRRMIKESLYIRAFDKGNLMNLKNPRPTNSVWNKFQSAI